jgi:hypothetical protein
LFSISNKKVKLFSGEVFGVKLRLGVAYVGVIFLALALALFIPLSMVDSQVAEPLRLRVYVAPPKVPADNNIHECIYIQLQDSRGRPARAPEDVLVHLSSSATYVGSTEPEVTIPKGHNYAVAKFYATYTPGSTVITAAALGYVTGQATMTTAGPVPVKLAVYISPPVLPPDGGVYEAIVVQLQDEGGTPARAPLGDVWVTLSSSNTTVGSCPSMVVIRAGETFTRTLFYSGLSSGTTVITAMASGYAAGQATVKTESSEDEPKALKVYAAPPKLPAEGSAYEAIMVQLQDARGRPAKASSDIRVDLSSSNLQVGGVDEGVVIYGGRSCAMARFISTFRAGGTVITAASMGYTSGQASLTTVGPIPSKLTVYPALPALPADGNSSRTIVVQLQDAGGTPAKDPEGVVQLDLFSSQSEVGLVTQRVLIPYGGTYAVTTFNSTYIPGTTSITAISAGYASGQASLTTHLIDLFSLMVKVTAEPTVVNSSDRVSVRVYVSYEGRLPAKGATVSLTSSQGGTFTKVVEEGNGYYTATFTAPNVVQKTVCRITANASKKGYLDGNGTIELVVNPVFYKGSLTINVADTDNNPLKGAIVASLSQPPGQQPLKGSTDEKGRVVFSDIIAGGYRFQVNMTGFEPREEEITVRAGGSLAVTVNLSRLPSPLQTLLTFPYVLAPIAAIIGAGAFILLLWRRRRTKEAPETPEEEEFL